MKKNQKEQIFRILAMLDQVHDAIQHGLENGKIHTALSCLEDCQQAAIEIGTNIEKSEGEGTKAVIQLEEYCELLYHLHEDILAERAGKPAGIYKTLHKRLLNIKSSIENEIPVRKEVVFLPYKASMWDSLESIWRTVDADPKCDARVIPIPYYDRNQDGSFGKFHYEGQEYPPEIPIIHYEEYDFEGNHPDEIYIHNPYDNNNFVTSVHPFFYSDNLKKFTDKLIYVPYFVLAEPDLNDPVSLEKMSHFARTKGVLNADSVIVQSENMRLCYIKVLTESCGEGTRAVWENKIIGTGSPKFDKISKMKRADIRIPKEWEQKIAKADGRWKKVILYNTSVNALLQSNDLMLKKIESVLKLFYAYKEEVVLLWRPHPLIRATIGSMRPKLWENYKRIVDRYKNENWGIYDESSDLDRAIALADAYYGDQSSVVVLCQSVGVPVMIQNVHKF